MTATLSMLAMVWIWANVGVEGSVWYIEIFLLNDSVNLSFRNYFKLQLIKEISFVFAKNMAERVNILTFQKPGKQTKGNFG